jgi:hypothetical protein
MLFVFNFCITLYVHSQLCSHNVQNMVHHNYLVLFTSLCCPLDAGFRLREKARDGLLLGSMGPSMNTSSLGDRASQRGGGTGALNKRGGGTGALNKRRATGALNEEGGQGLSTREG